MVCSPEKLAANRRNARMGSTGPRTEAGKQRSRLNAVKHGLTGEGFALPVEDEAEVEARYVALGDDLKPVGERERSLARRAAFLSLRLERCAQFETAALAEAIRTAVADHDDDRRREVEDAVKRLTDDPMASVRRLARSPEGLDWSIGAWEELGRDMEQLGYWQYSQLTRAENLLGRRSDESCGSRVNALVSAVNGDFRLMDPPGTPYPADAPARREAAKLDLLALIRAEVERLKALRAALPWDDLARSRAEAPLRRLFDPSQSGTLLRRYETTTARELYQILDRFDAPGREPDDQPEAEPAPEKPDSTPEIPETCVELASFRNPEDSDPTDGAPGAIADPVEPPPPAEISPRPSARGRGRRSLGGPGRDGRPRATHDEGDSTQDRAEIPGRAGPGRATPDCAGA